MYYFKKLFLTKQNYNIIDKELLTIMAYFKKWHIYIKKAVEIIIYIDYKNLLIFIIIKILNKK